MISGWQRSGIGILLIIGLVLSGFLMVNTGSLYLEQDRALRDSRDDIVWRAGRLSPDMYNLVQSLYDYAQPDSEVNHQQIVLSLEILWSRIYTLDRGEAEKVLSDLGNTSDIIRDAKAILGQLEPQIMALQTGDRRDAIAIARTIDTLHQPFNELGLRLQHHFSAVELSDRAGLAQRAQYSMLYMAGLVLCSVFIVVLWLIETHRARRYSLMRDLAVRDAQRANQAKSKFLANTSHELRTPLNAILGFSHVMRDEMLGPMGNPRYRDYVDNIHDSGRQLLNLINDLLDLAEIESEKRVLRDTGLILPELLDQVIAIVSTRFVQDGKRIDNRCPADAPRLKADERAVKQILINLLINGLKFSHPGGVVTLDLETRPDGSLCLWVADTGIGMTEDQVHRALLPFQHSDHDMNRTQGGSGLGLPISKSLAELHGGSLRVDSAPGRGTTVTVCFPADRVQDPVEAVSRQVI